MRKLNCCICDRCRKVLSDRMDMIACNGKKRVMHYCTKCYDFLRKKDPHFGDIEGTKE